MLEKCTVWKTALCKNEKFFLTSQLEFLEEYEIGINTEEVKETDESTAGSGNFW